ncbi:23S rRNA pseudouridine(2604) synthase RluF [Clostridium chrysemydis]|uniref:23S rRNA pseudouridine(2604) synthase RluF n=1 Tax=Clostridium chrysemydis TaxID=2665504 RepID=UPI00188357BA|nr:23S rRNA pseudouridine(2604) synthase RluF [Clostridium chrysemydis]
MSKRRFKNNNNSNVEYKPKKTKKPKVDAKKIIVHEDRSEEIRLNKYISETGICSRREADKLIESGRVYINGEKASMGTKVKSSDKVKVDGKLISKEEELVYIVLNKPVGITCTTEKKIKGNIVDFINHEKRIFNIGRLDKDSEGLIFMTNDGDIVNKILRAGNNHEKEYIVTVDKKIDGNFIKKMGNGIKILDKVTKKCFVSKENAYTFRIILTEGMNRQIRRMCEALGYEVKKLKRIRIMNVKLDGLRTGEWRYMTEGELKGINKLIKSSSKEKE